MNCLKKFESDDILFHYTKTTTALEHILFNKKLRLSDRVKSNDPIENMTPKTLINVESLENETYDNWDKYVEDIVNKTNQIKQVCFCKNDMSAHFKKMDDKPHEFYGCMKPRMWEQYADNYNGVCLILSKDELLKQLDRTFKKKKIKYVKYNNLKEKESEVNLAELIDPSYDICKKKVFAKIDKFMFHKHRDYKGENEYRIFAYSDKDLYINIESALRGIIVSKNNSLYFKKQLCVYEDKCNILEIDWKSSGVKLEKLGDMLKVRELNKAICKKNSHQ